MKIVTVKTQAEFDAIAPEDDVHIVIRDAVERIAIREKYEHYIEVYNSDVANYGRTLVSVWEGSTANAYINSEVAACKGSTVNAYRGSTVRAFSGSTINAHAGSIIRIGSNAQAQIKPLPEGRNKPC